jgi:hypothetical protein
MENHRVRALFASRKAVLSKGIDLESEIRGLLKVFGIKLPAKLGHGSFEGQDPWPPACRYRRGPKTCRHPAPHVAR